MPAYLAISHFGISEEVSELSPLEKLRRQVVEQQIVNEWNERAVRLSTAAVLFFIEEKMKRRGIRPNTKNLHFLEVKGIERNIFSFKYSGGFFSMIFNATPNTETDEVELEIRVVESVPSIPIGFTTGQRFMVEKPSRYELQ